MVNNNMLLLLLGLLTISLSVTDRRVGYQNWWMGVVSGVVLVLIAINAMGFGS